MSSVETEVTHGEEAEATNPQRRNLAMALFGALGGVALLEACATEPEGLAPEALDTVRQASLGGVSVKVVDTVLGLAPPGARTTGDLNKRPTTLDGANPPTLVIAKRCITGIDGGGGIFVWNATGRVGDVGTGAGLVDDGGTIIVPGGAVGTSATAAPGGCWQRIHSGALNVRWFGARGDNAATTNDQPAFAAAIAAVAPAGGTVYVPNGTYRVASPVVLQGPTTAPNACGSGYTQMLNNVRLLGESRGAIIRAAPPASFSGNVLVTLLGCSGCTLEQLTIQGVPGSTNLTGAVYIHANQGGTGRNKLINLKIGGDADPSLTEFDDGIVINTMPGPLPGGGCAEGNNEEHVFQNLEITRCRANGMYFLGASNSNWNNIIGGSIGYCTNGIRCAGGNFVLFGTGFGPLTNTILSVYAEDDPSAFAQRYYALLMVGARAESVAKIIETTGPGRVYARFVDLSCVLSGDPIVTFQSPNGFLSFESCQIIGLAPSPVQHRSPINVSGTNAMLTITNSRLEIDAVNLSNNAEAHLSGNLWVHTATAGGPRVTGGKYTAIGEHALPGGVVPIASLGTSLPGPTPPAVPGQIYKDASGFLKIV